MPIQEYIYETDDDEARSRAVADASSIGSLGVFVHGKDTTLNLIEAGNKTGSADVYERLCERCNNEISKLILGNTLTTESSDKGTQALGTVHKKVEDKVAQADKRFVLNVLNYDMADIFAAMGVNPDDDFREAVKSNNAVFSAFKVHRMQKDMAARLLDSNGNLKPFEQWSKEVLPIADHQVGRWLKTEYDTAVIRAHQAADWQQFEREKDILPNLKWMPSTSIHPGADHQVFWGTVRPINDKFWNEHRPGDRWNCKCSLSATDEPVTNVPGDIKIIDVPQKGLDSNPGKDGVIFSDNHPYFPKDCKHCAFYKPSIKNKLIHLFNASKVKDCYNCPYIDGCIPGSNKVNKEASIHIKEIKKSIDCFNGVDVSDSNFISGSIKILRRSLQDVYEHNKENIKLMQWLSSFNLTKLGGWKYEGWAKNRTYEPTHPKFDPKNPNKTKHPETDYFLYYSLMINGEKYWANVKWHNHYKAEILYTIEKERPSDLQEGKPKR